jgi:hypothetical protein
MRIIGCAVPAPAVGRAWLLLRPSREGALCYGLGADYCSWSRVWWVAVVSLGVERCSWGMQADLGDEGGGGCREMQLGNANLGDERGWRWQRATITGAACGSGGGCREMQLGKANLGDKGNEGKEPSSLGPRVGAVVRGCREASCERRTCGANLGGGGNEGKAPSSLEPRVGGAVVGVERCNLGKQILVTGWVPDLPRGRGGRGPVWGLLPMDGSQLS